MEQGPNLELSLGNKQRGNERSTPSSLGEVKDKEKDVCVERSQQKYTAVKDESQQWIMDFEGSSKETASSSTSLTASRNRGRQGKLEAESKKGMEMIKQMPSVSTTGPHGKRVQGFLCDDFMTGHVKIMCICHATPLSPADFLKHAGATDLSNPMKHIIVHSHSL